MTTVFSILSLPKTSDGLAALRPTSLATSSVEDESESLPHKVARLNTDRDSASAFRSKQVASAKSEKQTGPIYIQIIGDHKDQPAVGKKQLSLLHQCIRIVLGRNRADVLPASYEGIYGACRLVVAISHLGRDLYDIVKLELEQATGQMANELSELTENDVGWIISLNSTFNWFEKQISLLESLLTYLDQSYVVNEKGVLKLRERAYRLVSERVFGNVQVAEKLRKSVQDWLAYERTIRLEHSERAGIRDLIQHLLRHHQYSFFEEFYLETTRSFYLEESMTVAEKLKGDPKLFFKRMQDSIESEVERAKVVLPVSAWAVVREFTEQAVWKGRMEWLARSTLSSYLAEKKFESLGRMYTLFARVGGTKAIMVAFREHIQSTVANIVKDADREDDMVKRLLDFKALADEATTSCFVCEKVVVSKTTSDTIGTGSGPTPSTSQIPPKLPDQEFVYALTDSFAKGFKARRLKPAEMIAKYLDKAMRKGQGKASDAEFQDVLDKALALYRFTDDKDVFRTFYHRSLAKRLLLEKSASDDFEKSMLKKLKEHYDPEFGMGEEMFKDLSLSRDSMRDYHAKLPENSLGCKLTAMVLQRSAWPFSVQEHSVDLPPAMQGELTKYSDYYKSKHSNYVLDWNHSLGTMILRARFNSGIKELSVSLYQGITLLLFNDAFEISFMDIKDQTNMDSEELRRTLQSLACGKKKVLKKIPPGRNVADSDIFKFNPDFEDPHPKIHINSIQAKVSPEESQRTNASIEDDRKFYLDAAIVRIMKAKKEMTYEQLKTATVDEVKKHFVPLVELIKKRIESLVDQEYLERSEDRTKFLYVA